MMKSVVTRFAPSPTGLLHLGHVYALKVAVGFAKERGGHCLLRIEDIDFTRCREIYVEKMMEDLNWLGYEFNEVVRQSSRQAEYSLAMTQLKQMGVVYPCFCTRKRLGVEVNLGAPQEGDAVVKKYDGYCRGMSDVECQLRIERNENVAWRLNIQKCRDLVGDDLMIEDLMKGCHRVTWDELDDVIIARKDIGISYHLAVVIDDAWQGVTHVTRGEDLLSSTPIHRILQALLKLPVPVWYHHRLIRDEGGKRLAKRDSARSIQSLRDAGMSPNEVLQLLHAS
jgi:glutamyl-Q tRNA(Asp) synthetase